MQAEELKQRMASQFDAVYQLCVFIFENSANVSKKLLALSINVYSGFLKWFPFEIVFSQNIFNKFLNDMENYTAIRIDVMKFFIEIFSIPLSVEVLGQDTFFAYKNTLVDSFAKFVNVIYKVSNGTNFAVEAGKTNPQSRDNFEKFSLQLVLSLTSFFYNNFSFIENFNFIQGTGAPNQFLTTYQEPLFRALSYISQITCIKNDEILNVCSEFWGWFGFKICFLKNSAFEPHQLEELMQEGSLFNYVGYSNQTYLFKTIYEPIINDVRQTLIMNMTKPNEINFSVDEFGDIYTEDVANTIFDRINEQMKNALIYFTHINSTKMETEMVSLVSQVSEDQTFNPHLLNSINWSIGAISGAMEGQLEKRFLIQVIKVLLNLCEKTKGKRDKAVVASCIMYVVGQYPAFLNCHWKFLKTVVKKLFEFMHEMHPGVRDFACETFLKISLKCGYNFVIQQEGEEEPFLVTLGNTVKQDTHDLENHQKLMFYESLGNLIAQEADLKRRSQYVMQVMNDVYQEWSTIFSQIKINADALLDINILKVLNLLVKINERVCISVGNSYFDFCVYILEDLIKAYAFLVDCLDEVYKNGYSNEEINKIRLVKLLRKSVLVFLKNLVSSFDDLNLIVTNVLPYISTLIEKYRSALPENKDAEVLPVFTELLVKIQNTQYQYVVSIWDYLCLDTLQLISTDFSSFPEHRVNFYKLVKALISNSFECFFLKSSFPNH